MRIKPSRRDFLADASWVAAGDEAVTAFRKGRPLGDLGHRWLAATDAQLSRDQDATAAVAEYLKLAPDFPIARHLELMPFQRPEDREHYAEGLCKAGLPERGRRAPVCVP